MNYTTLLLDACMTPIKTINWQRAITLLTLGKIEIIESYDGFVRSPSMVIKIPAVARLVKMFKRRKRPVKFTRIALFARDDYTCGYCGTKGTLNELTYDHVMPKSRGGKSDWLNIITSCGPCNNLKGGRTPEEAKMKLLWQPYKPDWVPVLEIQLSKKDTPEEWRSFLYWNVELDSD